MHPKIWAAKEAFDWESYLTLHYDIVLPASGGRELRVDCPHPDCGNRNKKCYINMDSGWFHCFTCDFQVGDDYNLFDFMAYTEGISPAVAMLRVMQDYTPTAPTDEEFEALTEDAEPLPVDNKDTPRYLDSLPKTAKRLITLFSSTTHTDAESYAHSRGIGEDEALAANLHYVDKWTEVKDSQGNYKGNLKNRIIIPLYHNRKLCGWQARAIDPKVQPKYLNCPETDMAKTLWPCVPPMEGQRVVIVEGVFDALSVRKAGFSAYATFTKKISPAQMRLLKSWGVDEVTLWFDKKDALPQMVKAVEDLKMRFDKVYVPSLKGWPKDQDAGNLLSNADGNDIISNTLNECIDVYNTLEYAQWTQGFY